MAEEVEFTFTREFVAEMIEAIKFVRALRRSQGQGMQIGANGLTIQIPQSQFQSVLIDSKFVLTRISGTNSGAGKYDGYIQILGASNTAKLGTNNVALSEIGLSDGTRVSIWNTTENTTVANTNRTHMMTSGQYVIGLPAPFTETISGTPRSVIIGVGLPPQECL